MAHIHTNNGEHDHTVSAFIVRQFEDNEWRVFLHMHKKLHTLMHFGGHVELNETPWQALTHELKEESGYDINSLKIILSPPKIGLTNTDEHYAPFSVNTHAFDTERSHFHTDSTYAFIADKEPTLQMAEGESQDVRWLTLSEIIELDDTEIYSNIRELVIYVLKTVSKLTR